MNKANTIKARYDSGVSNFAHDNSGVAVPIKIDTDSIEQIPVLANLKTGFHETNVGGVSNG